MKNLLDKPWLKAYSGLSINISAAWFGTVFVGPFISLPRTKNEFTLLIWATALGIIFLLLSVWCERRLIK